MPTDLGGIDPGAVTADDPSPVTDKDRLRDAFAQLIARQRGQAVPMNALMQAQAMQQGLKPPPPPLGPGGADFTGKSATPMPQAVPPGPQMNFPTAPANPNMNRQFQAEAMPPKEKPFHGQGTYALPKQEKPPRQQSMKKKGKANG